MSESPEIFYDALEEKERQKSLQAASDSTSSQPTTTRRHEYFELELEKEEDATEHQTGGDTGDHQQDTEDVHKGDKCKKNDDEDDPRHDPEDVMSKEDKFKKEKKSSFKRFNNMVKSKVDVLGKTKMFGGGKKKAGKCLDALSEDEDDPLAAEHFDKPDKGGKNGEMSTLSTEKRAKGRRNAESIYDKPKSSNVSSSSVAMGGTTEETAPAEPDAAKDAAQMTSGGVSGALAGARSPIAYDSIWPETPPPQENIEESPYELAKPVTQESMVTASLSASDSTSIQHSGIYNVAACIPNQQPVLSFQADNKTKITVDSTSKLYYMSTIVPVLTEESSQKKDSLRSMTTSANRGCIEGVGQPFPVDFMNPLLLEDCNAEYSRLMGKATRMKLSANKQAQLRQRGYDTIGSVESMLIQGSIGNVSEDNPEEESASDYMPSEEEEEEGDFSWGSEFDEYAYQDGIEELLSEVVDANNEEEASDKPLPPKPGKGKVFLRNLKVNSRNPHDPSSMVCFPVTINPKKHPPPVLPPIPQGLSENQMKRRMIVDLIINSERSYLESLERLIKEYERTVMDATPHSKSHIRPVFAEMKEIVSHHKMFQIELSETVRVWDDEEKIGDIFTASFSKSMLINSYSIYVNNFAAAMEEIRSLQRNRQSFDDFLKKQEKFSHDRLSIFGLMVKPVQRFPQFIMFLQDLIKYTPQNHCDRRSLQLALTELENVAYKLNERKRQSEQKFQAQHTVQQLIRMKVQHMLTSWNLDMENNRRLIRSDTIEQVYGEFDSMKCKERRLILMNDMVLCVKVMQKEQAGFSVERLSLRWMVKLKDLELKETAVTPNMQTSVIKDTGKIQIMSTQPVKPEEDPFHLYADLSEMLHDYTVLGQISGLLASLKRSYISHGLREELIHEVSRDLQRMIQIKDEQLRLVNSCSIIMEDTSRSDKSHYVMQTSTATIKQDWCVDFMIAKLALDKSNSLAWVGARDNEDTEFDVIPAYFMKHLSVDVPRNYTKIRCAVSIFLGPETLGKGLGVQHLWVCSSIATHGQVSVLSIHNSRPALMESFRACNCDIMNAELVPGCGQSTKPEQYCFSEDTVWVSTSHNEILIFPMSGENGGVRRDPISILRITAVAMSVKFVDERIFCGLDNGNLAVYSRNSAGGWGIKDPPCLNFGSTPIKIHFVHEEDLWLSCANKLCVVEIDSLKTKAIHVLHASHESALDHVVKVGVGIWVSFRDSSFIKLFHIESMESLQEISVGTFVNRIRGEKLWNKTTENLVVTSLAASKGLLWIGTSVGLILTVLLPRLSDGVPLYRGRPTISLHAHKGPVKFLLPMQNSSSILELNRASSLRSTIRSRQSQRNIERERIELEESERHRGTSEIIITPPESEQSLKERTVSFQDSSQSHMPLANGSGISKQGEESGGEVSANGLPSPATHVKKVVASQQRSVDRNEIQRSFDDSCLEVTKKATKDVDRKSKTLSFRSELAQRIIGKRQSLTDLDSDLSAVEPHEVEMLYENLLEDELNLEASITVEDVNITDNEDQSGNSFSTGATIPTSSSNSHSQITTPSCLKTSTPVQSEEQKNETDIQLPEGKKSVLALATSSMSVASPISSSSSSSQFESSSDIFLSPFSHQASPIRTLQRGGTTRMTTMRKISSNAVTVISGGDGYCDLDTSRSNSTTDDASILLWIYKF